MSNYLKSIEFFRQFALMHTWVLQWPLFIALNALYITLLIYLPHVLGWIMIPLMIMLWRGWFVYGGVIDDGTQRFWLKKTDRFRVSHYPHRVMARKTAYTSQKPNYTSLTEEEKKKMLRYDKKFTYAYKTHHNPFKIIVYFVKWLFGKRVILHLYLCEWILDCYEPTHPGTYVNREKMEYYGKGENIGALKCGEYETKFYPMGLITEYISNHYYEVDKTDEENRKYMAEDKDAEYIFINEY